MAVPKMSKVNKPSAEEMVVKKRPSKAELKSIIEYLKKDAKLIVVRKACKYIPFYLKSEGLTKKLLKEVVRLWAEAGEKIRVVCLLILIRIYTKLEDKERKQEILKKLHSSFNEKCRITKRETMSMIAFMRHSLIEIYKLDPPLAFNQARSSCQQITLALKSESYKSVLNWQFANSLILLSNLVISQEDGPIKSLIHQVIQLNLSSISLLTSPRYYPFYCHLIENLINLSVSANLFIPILPLMLAILDKLSAPLGHEDKSESRKKRTNSDNHDEMDCSDEESPDEEKKQKHKEYDMNLLNHVSMDEAHLHEYNVAVLDKIYELMVKYLASQCHKIAFPELVLLPNVQIKKWLKKNPGQPARKFKTLLNEIKHDCEILEESRRTINFEFTNYTAVDAWEKKMVDSNKLNLPNLVGKL